MTPTEINEAIARACGWKQIHILLAGNRFVPPDAPFEFLEHSKPIPNYYSDLNAMHEAEATLRIAPNTMQPGGIGHYLNLLDEMTGEPIRATAPQRAEAFMRCLGLWKEETK